MIDYARDYEAIKSTPGGVWFQDIGPLVWRWGVSGHVSAFKMVL